MEVPLQIVEIAAAQGHDVRWKVFSASKGYAIGECVRCGTCVEIESHRAPRVCEAAPGSSAERLGR
jgi:hypothetical protein